MFSVFSRLFLTLTMTPRTKNLHGFFIPLSPRRTFFKTISQTGSIEMETLLWLDDERDPTDTRWHPFFPIQQPEVIWVKSYAEFTEWITDNSLPHAICFDHDLGDGPSGMDAAKWLTEFCLDTNSPLPAWNIQSANPIGKMNIEALLNSFARAVDER